MRASRPDGSPVSDEFLDHLDEVGPTTDLTGTDSTNHPEGPPVLDDPEGAIMAEGEGWAGLALEYSKGAPWPGKDATPWDVKDALVEARARLDRVESLLAAALALRYVTMSRARKLELAADDAWDDRAGAERRRPRGDFTSAKEQHAYWNLDIRPQRQEARKARELADYVQSVHDRVRLHYDSLNTRRRDLDARLTHLRWESNQEQ